MGSRQLFTDGQQLPMIYNLKRFVKGVNLPKSTVKMKGGVVMGGRKRVNDVGRKGKQEAKTRRIADVSVGL